MNSVKQILSQLIKQVGIADNLIGKSMQAVSELREVDTLLNEISRVNKNLKKSDLKNIGKQSFQAAGRYGQKAADYLSNFKDASQAGYDPESADAIAELSMAAQNAGGMTAELANQYIIATDRAYEFGGSVEKLTEVLDGSSNISSRHAVSMTALAEGMSAVGSEAASLGVEADETTAALATMITATGQSGSDMGDAFRGILLNLRQITDEEEGIDPEGLARYEEACSALNVSLTETKNGITSLRDPMDILRDLSKEYAKLGDGDARKTDLLASVGGDLRADALDAILENYGMYEDMLQEYAQGTGTLSAEAEKAASSWEGSLNRLSDTWTATVGNIADSDAVVAAVDMLDGLLSIVDRVTGALGSLGSIGLGAGLFAGIKNVGGDKMHSLTLICFE